MIGSASGRASLPMYDWPEVRPATDRLWAALRDSLRAEGLPAPEELDREAPLETIWRAPDLALSMTCGLPLVRGAAMTAEVLGAFDYGLPGIPRGHYCSAVVVRSDDSRRTLAAFRGATLAFNGRDSQSGYGSIQHHTAPLAEGGSFFGQAIETGAHVYSAAAVAAGTADIAAIDSVSFRLFQRFRPEAARLRVLLVTDATPGLPIITAAGTDPARARRAVAAGVDAMDAETRTELGLVGFVPLDRADYGIIAERIAAAEARVALPRPGPA